MKPEEAIEELNHELLILKCLIEEVNSFICDCDVDDDEYDDEKEQFEIGLTRYKKEKGYRDGNFCHQRTPAVPRNRNCGRVPGSDGEAESKEVCY